MRGRFTLLVGLVATAVGLAAAPALADHHRIRITEVYAGNEPPGTDDMEYVELQMLAAGENQFAGHDVHVSVYDSAAQVTATASMPIDPLGGSQRFVLAGSDDLSQVGGAEADFTWDDGNHMDPAGGAACFLSDLFPGIDCVSWGNLTNGSSLPSPTGGNAPAMTPVLEEPQALHRSTARGCSRLLDDADDTSQPSDWMVRPPDPHDNDEVGPTAGCPDTRFTKAPPKKTTKRKAKFKFTATPAAASFECKLDRKPFKPCTSPFRKRVKPGKHKFRVLAGDEISPAVHRWKVVKD